MRTTYGTLTVPIMFLSIISILFSTSVSATPLAESDQEPQQNDNSQEAEQDENNNDDNNIVDGPSTAEQIEPELGQEFTREGQQSLDDSVGPLRETEKRYECDPKVASCQPPPPVDCDPEIQSCPPPPPPPPCEEELIPEEVLLGIIWPCDKCGKEHSALKNCEGKDQ